MGNSLFSFRLRVRYSETDAQGIVFNANYLTYFDVAVTEYFRAKLMPYNNFVTQYGVDFHVVHVEMDYKSPARSDDELTVDLSGTYAGAKVNWLFRIRRNDTLLLSGRVVYACVDRISGKVRRISQEIASALGWEPA